MAARPQKTWRMNYWTSESGSDVEASIALLDDPGEIRMGVGQKSFISVKEDSVSISGGSPCVINIQGMASSIKYGGMIQPLPWPLTMIPSTTFTPMVKEIIVPPLVKELPAIISTATFALGLL